ncbi:MULTISPECIES: bacteriohemerythrin [unclassified Acetobacterium]|jgi:hemerythrin|uniref:bacteriohemerythrin n=1 Tax=unclassified Acetobacterium TaxID=2638182 RepID=UPI000DBECB4A|nr:MULTISPECIES: bacteriohemerythrin [unclassified Acetobacterium]AWW25590.1 hemerythrin [Acetobacterium sp. KB-1]MDZ5724536.1 bacteriohemerythrin [Acetobacterium sp. K1/6]
MAIVWTQDLSVGVASIDGQHQQLFKMADELFEAGKNGKSKEVVGELLNFLDAYTKQHFSDEEAYMKSINYPGLADQQTAHKNFIAELAKLKSAYDTSGGNISVIINANQMVVDWLTKHISVMDKKIGVHTKA